jgi:cytochrome c peroxidase
MCGEPTTTRPADRFRSVPGARAGVLGCALLCLGWLGCATRSGPGLAELAPREQPVASPAAGALSAATLRALRELSPRELPLPPPDPTNRYADDPAAAALGHELFFDPSFSGRLIDPDNIGDAASLGSVGDTGKVSCAGCHLPERGFVDTRSVRQQVSLAAGWGRRKTRSLLDIGQAKILMWDGRRDALYNQPFQPIETADEMNSSRLYVAQQIYARHRSEYEAIFGPIPVPLDDASRFAQLDGATTGCRAINAENEGVDCHGMPGDGAEFDRLSQADQDAVTRVVVNMGKALGAYERKLSCGQSRFDRWIHGDAGALTAEEQRGAAIFVGQRADGSTRLGCNSCHSGPFFTDQSFHNVGMHVRGVGPAGSFFATDDRGAQDGLTKILVDPLNTRGKFSDGYDGRLPEHVPASAEGAFRTPSLRCVSRRPSFMRNGQLRTLADVIDFFSRGGDQGGYFGTKVIEPFEFTAQERADLEAFLRALDGDGPDPALIAAPSSAP